MAEIKPKEPKFPYVIDILICNSHGGSKSMKALRITENIFLIREGRTGLFIACEEFVTGRNHALVLISSGLKICTARKCGMKDIMAFAEKIESMPWVSFSADELRSMAIGTHYSLLEEIKNNKHMSVY
jgi:hypothetical protein